LKLICGEGGTYILIILLTSSSRKMFIHESRQLEMWSVFFYADNSEVHNAAFNLVKIGISSSCEHGTEPLGHKTGA
jgi:hypothetical protein